MNMVNNSNFKMAVKLLDNYYNLIKNNDIYSNILASGIFNDEDVSQALYSVNDESYKYIVKEMSSMEGFTLINLFSGSGRFIKELSNLHLAEIFDSIYNIDSSIYMINFEKKQFQGNNSIKYICEDVLNVHFWDYKKKCIVCHCGVRYLKKQQLSAFVNKIKELLIKNSICYISETKLNLIDELINELGKYNLHCELEEKNIIVHRNTKLYVCFWLYRGDLVFKKHIDQIATQYREPYFKILTEVSGYKKCKLFVLKVYGIL